MTDHLSDPGPLIPGRRHHAFVAEARELLRLAVPLAATQLAQMIILATDTVMLGHFSKEALAAGALGNTVYFLIWLLGNGLPMAVSPVIAHVQGKHAAATKPRDQREVLTMRFVVGQEIYNHLERVIDRFEDVANEVQGLVLDHA